jgi:hypothetical protein
MDSLLHLGSMDIDGPLLAEVGHQFRRRSARSQHRIFTFFGTPMIMTVPLQIDRHYFQVEYGRHSQRHHAVRLLNARRLPAAQQLDLPRA